jgi:insertion element IS1 protein InsB
VKGEATTLILVQCPYCQSGQVIKGGKTDTGKQRYRCHTPDCSHQSCLLDSAYKGRSPAIKQQVIDMSLNGSGVRDTARVVGISPTTVMQELKKKGPLSHW